MALWVNTEISSLPKIVFINLGRVEQCLFDSGTNPLIFLLNICLFGVMIPIQNGYTIITAEFSEYDVMCYVELLNNFVRSIFMVARLGPFIKSRAQSNSPKLINFVISRLGEYLANISGYSQGIFYWAKILG